MNISIKAGLQTPILQHPVAHITEPSRQNSAAAAPKPAVHTTSGTRLAYDSELNRAFVEFMNLRSGKVVSRYPVVTRNFVMAFEKSNDMALGHGVSLNAIV